MDLIGMAAADDGITVEEWKARAVEMVIREWERRRAKENAVKRPTKNEAEVFREVMLTRGRVEGETLGDGILELMGQGGGADVRSIPIMERAGSWEVYLKGWGIRVERDEVWIALGHKGFRAACTAAGGWWHRGRFSGLEGARIVDRAIKFDRMMNGYLSIPWGTVRGILAPQTEAR